MIPLSTARLGLCVLSLAAVVGCTHKGIVNFTATPELVCQGKPVVLVWEVDGAASLSAEPSPPDWADGTVPASGTRTVTVTSTTKFTLTSPDANAAVGGHTGSRWVKVVPPRDDRAASATCDDASKVCSGSFTLNTGGTSRALGLSNPRIRRAGVVTPTDVCVTPPKGAKTCINAGASASIASPVDGIWTLETKLKAEEATTPPPQLRIALDFGCP